jgi:hypothetical protein
VTSGCEKESYSLLGVDQLGWRGNFAMARIFFGESGATAFSSAAAAEVATQVVSPPSLHTLLLLPLILWALALAGRPPVLGGRQSAQQSQGGFRGKEVVIVFDENEVFIDFVFLCVVFV